MARILVIDDDVNIRTLIERHLMFDGHEVDLAENGKEGLQLVWLHKYDLVITDVFMPKRDGFEVMTELRRLSPPVRVIVITGGGADFSSTEILDMMRVMKANRGLSKPFDFDVLMTAVREELAAVKPT